MIFVDRLNVINPLDPSTKLGQQAVRETERIGVQLQSGEMSQKRIRVKAYRHLSVQDALNRLFQGKCAYCESELSASQPIDIEQFRPKMSVLESPEHPGYWWLANTWENLLAACFDCNRVRQHKRTIQLTDERSGKGNRFPLKNEKFRAFSPEGDISKEEPLLLDPTVDEPSEHLVFNETGFVYSDTDRGNTTIAVLGLNRKGLLQARKKVIQRFSMLVNVLDNTGNSADVLQSINDMAMASAPYAGMVRQAIQQNKFLRKTLNSDMTQTAISKTRLRKARTDSFEYMTQMSDYSLDTDGGVQKFKSQQRVIERITIKNIRAIRKLDLDLTDQTNGSTPWLMLLGENGTGKSTVLQSIAILLSGHEQVRKLMERDRLDPSSLVRYRCQSGRVRVKLSGFIKPHELVIYRDRLVFHSPHGEVTTVFSERSMEGSGWDAQTLVLGYGATRLLPKKPSSSLDVGFGRIENLFDAFVPLIDAQSWLMRLKQRTFDDTAIILKDLLNLDEQTKMIRSTGEVWIKTPGSKTSLKNLSDGYQAIVAMTVDILDVLSRIWPRLSEAEGIVLIDELDAHLHPTWQMKIVGSLRKALPGVQFIATTHQPLCLRGLMKGEVIVMQRTKGGLVEPLTNLPSPQDFRVDQLLTSEFFGMNSTIDPETEELFDAYYALLAIDNRTSKQEETLSSLRTELDGRRRLGDTQRETLFYETIDTLLSKQTTSSRLSPENLQDEAIRQVSALWNSVIDENEPKT